MNLANIFSAYIQRLPLRDLNAIAAAYAAVWQEQNSGNAGSQDAAGKKLETAIVASLDKMLDHDKANIEKIIEKSQFRQT